MKKRIILATVFLGFFLWLYFAQEARAACPPYCNKPDECNLELECVDLCPPDPDCGVEGNTCTTGSCSSLSAQDYCCNSWGGCSPNLGGNCNSIDLWDYCHDPACKVTQVGFRCSWSWSFQNCDSVDTCLGDGPYLYSGNCGSGSVCPGDTSGCKMGGKYKTCCEGNGVSFTGNLGGNCTGGCRNGYCPDGSAPVVCDVSQSVCDDLRNRGYACTTAACGWTACQAVRSGPPPVATNTPIPGATNTPMPTAVPTESYEGICQGDGKNAAPKVCDAWIDIEVPPTATLGTKVNLDLYMHAGWNNWCGGGNYTAYAVHQETGATYTFHFPDATLDTGWATAARADGTIMITAGGAPQEFSSGVLRYRYSWNTNSSCNNQACPAGHYTFNDGGTHYIYGGHGDHCWWADCCDYNADFDKNTWTKIPLLQSLLGKSATNRAIELTGDIPPPPVGACPSGKETQIDLGAINPAINPEFEYGGWGNWVIDYGGEHVFIDLWSGNHFVNGWSVLIQGDSPEYKIHNIITNAMTPIIPGDTYSIQIYGSAHRGNILECEAYLYSQMKLSSGNIETNYYNASEIRDDVWRPLRMNIRVPNPWPGPGDPWIRVDLRSRGQDCWGWWPTGRTTIFDHLWFYHCCIPKPPEFFTCIDSPTTTTTTSYPASWHTPVWNNCSASPDTTKFTVYADTDGNDPHTPVASCTNIPGGGGEAGSVVNCTLTNLTPGSFYKWQVEATNNDGQKRPSSICSFTVVEPKPWWQTKDGDVHGENVASLLPSGEELSEIGDNGGNPGVVGFGAGLDYHSGSGGKLSATNWKANTPPNILLRYTSLFNQLGGKSSALTCSPIPCIIPPTMTSPTIWSYSGNLRLGVRPVLNTEKIILFVDGDVSLEKVGSAQLKVDTGGFFAIVASGKITFTKDLTLVEGFYLADSTIEIPTNGTKNDSQFTGRGSFIGLAGINLSRDLGSVNNATKWAEYFSPRWDLYLNAPKEFLITPFIFQETAP